MTSNLVSARVPYAKKEAVVSVLKSLGVTTSDLINDAFDFVLSHKALPSSSVQPKGEQKDFASFLQATTFSIPWDEIDADDDYKNILREGRAADYESFA